MALASELRRLLTDGISLELGVSEDNKVIDGSILADTVALTELSAVRIVVIDGKNKVADPQAETDMAGVEDTTAVRDEEMVPKADSVAVKLGLAEKVDADDGEGAAEQVGITHCRRVAAPDWPRPVLEN